jgi:hypothetical protein
MDRDRLAGSGADRGAPLRADDNAAPPADDNAVPPADDNAVPPVDITVARQARIYDFLLGGKDNFAADRDAAAQAIEAFPGLVAWAPQALLHSTREGATAYISADLRDPETILEQAAATLDFSQPAALMLLAILHVIPESDDPWEVVTRLMAGLPSGSYLVISHPARDIHADAVAEMTKRFNQRMGGVMSSGRTYDEVARFFTGLELVEPGIVSTPRWRPDPGIEQPADPAYAAVARKP